MDKMNKGRTLVLMFVILGISACLVAQAWAIPMTRLDITVAGVEVSEVAVGSSFDLNVIVYENDPFAFDFVAIFGFVTTLTPDTASAFTINEIVMADGIDPFEVPALPVSYPGQYISGTANADPLVPINYGEDTLLATLDITANNVGLFELGIVSDLDNPFEGLLTAFSSLPFDMGSSTSINVAAAPVPEPGTVVLMLMGLGGLGLLKRKRS
jgi:hypothetical protein